MSSVAQLAPAGGPRDHVPVEDLPDLAPALTSLRGALRAPVDRAATWRAFAQAGTGFGWCLLTGILVMVGVAVSAGLVLIVVGLPLLTWTLLGVSRLAAVERTRLSLQLGLTVPAPTYRAADSPRLRILGTRAILTDPRRWREVAYFCIALWVTTLEFLVIGVLGGAALGALVLPVVRRRAFLTPTGRPWDHEWEMTRAAAASGVGTTVAIVVGGVLLVWVAPIVLQATTRMHARLAANLLGPSQDQRETQALARQVQTLRVTRTEAVDAADADRRRIERDLHDGAQQRLVALGVELGIAKRAAEHDPATAGQALDHAHGEVKEILAELRDLVRGIHPAVLTDRGLDAALGGLAARSPIPVTVQVEGAEAVARLSPSTQAAAYFIAAEALTNAARHSGATRAQVHLGVRDGVMTMSVADDGRGGAQLTAGGGLEGLKARVVALDGTFELTSPPAGGTRIDVEI